jgi:hypothetical protein
LDIGLRVAPLDQVIRSPYESGGFLFGGIMAGESLMLAEIKYLQSENKRLKDELELARKEQGGFWGRKAAQHKIALDIANAQIENLKKL